MEKYQGSAMRLYLSYLTLFRNEILEFFKESTTPIFFICCKLVLVLIVCQSLKGVPHSLKNESGQDWRHCEMLYAFRNNESYGDHMRRYFSPPVPSQGWFLVYLFVYSQIFAGLFTLIHPNHQVKHTISILWFCVFFIFS